MELAAPAGYRPARYADAMERVFWNTVAGAVSRRGTEFFYSNTLHLRTGHDDADEDSPRHRLRWYQCACCPPNLARLLASIQAYLVTRDESGLQVHIPFSGALSTRVPGGTVDLKMQTGHPWAGTTDIEVTRCSSTERWGLSLRLPDWAGNDRARLSLNGHPIEASLDGSYVKVARNWAPGDRIEVSTEVPVRVLRPHWRADAIRGSVAVQRGPFVYCVEAEDLKAGTAVEDVVLDAAGPLVPALEVPNELEGYVKVVIRGEGQRVIGSAHQLYDESPEHLSTQPVPLTFVPYFARGNRPSSAMRVWVPTFCEHNNDPGYKA